MAPRTAQAAMRHSSLDLTMNVYTDPTLLDVPGALEALPARSVLAFLLAGLIAAGVWPAASAQENAGPATRRAQLAQLAAGFERDRALYMSERFSERETREQFLNEFFTILGWDVENRGEVFLYQQDTIPEARLRLGDTMHYADYAFRVDARTRFYCEAKAASLV